MEVGQGEYHLAYVGRNTYHTNLFQPIFSRSHPEQPTMLSPSKKQMLEVL